MKKNCVVLLLIIANLINAQEKELNLSYYLPQNISYNPNIPTPKEIIGHEVGSWHITHDKLMYYMQTLAKHSNRITLENRGRTFEGRPIQLLTISAPKNINNIDQIQTAHLALSNSEVSSEVLKQMPIVVYQGFSIHGNEPSGSNAALAYAYYLAAAQGTEIENTLNNTIILLDPAFNPDGLQRFAYWANTNKAHNLNPDPNDREFHEVWPGGRTNHYWFDMNRDWLPVQLPESRARIASFHKWLPNIVTDHHEMGTNSSFFFQPGEASRVHPLTPKVNQLLTKKIGFYHAQALNKIGSLYYSEENYDDYYYGKGSTFPDVNGSIGILFEQGSSRGHIQESENGLLSFPFTIKNQFTTALSTIEAAFKMKDEILNYQQEFFKTSRSEAAKNKGKSIVFGDAKDAAKSWHLAEILKRQNISFKPLAKDQTLNGNFYKKENSYVVPLNQKNHKLVKAIFEKRTSFKDSLFYDVSAWTFPLAFNVDYTETTQINIQDITETILPSLKGSISTKSSYAYLFQWHEYYTPKALNAILNKGIRAKFSKAPFTLEGTTYDYGTILIPVVNQSLNPEELYSFLEKTAIESHINIKGVSGGLAQGIDLGSNEFDILKKQKVGLLVGNGITPYDAGEIWHLFDTRYQMKITKLDLTYFNSIDLEKYTDLIIPNIRNSELLTEKTILKIKTWVKNGGTLIGYRNTVKWLHKNEFINLEIKKDSLVAKNISFNKKQDFYGAQITGGAIFNTVLDRSHPINFGFKNNNLPVFRNTNIFIKAHKNSFNNPIKYTNNPLLSGYVSKENLANLKNTVPFKVAGFGRGKVMAFTDNSNFRAFWYGTNKLLMNAIFFGNSM